MNGGDGASHTLLQLLAQLANLALINDVRKVLQVERYVIRPLGQKNRALTQSVSESHFIKDVWIPTGHVRDNDIRFDDLIVDPVENPLLEDLLIYSFTVRIDGFARLLDTDLVHVIELLIERH